MPRPLIAHVVGARPNYMKVAPVYAELERRGNVDQRLVHTGQHYDTLMKDVFFTELPLPSAPDEAHAATAACRSEAREAEAAEGCEAEACEAGPGGDEMTWYAGAKP